MLERTFKDYLVQPMAGTSFIRSGCLDPEGEINDGKMKGLQTGLESALTESDFSSLLNVHFFIFSLHFLY